MPALIYLGPTDDSGPPLLWESAPLEPGTALPLSRLRSTWRVLDRSDRVVLGSHGRRADILLEGEGIYPEHIRFYVDVHGGPTDLRAMHGSSTRLDGELLEALEYRPLSGGEEIDIAGWRFRYDRDAAGSTSPD